MRILLLSHGFNSLTQRVFVELRRGGHEVSVELDIHDQVTEEAVALFQPDLVVAPFLKRPIPESVWRSVLCWIIHPGPLGDRGPAALDWAIELESSTWGVTVLQAVAEMDAGPVWASVDFPMRAASKSSLYRREVTNAAIQALALALERLAQGVPPQPLVPGPDGSIGIWRPGMRAQQRRIDWSRDDTRTIVRRIRAADGSPGVRDRVGDREVRLYGAWPEAHLRGFPGEWLATRDGAVCRATMDGAVWMTHMRSLDSADAAERSQLKLPATEVLGASIPSGVPEIPLDPFVVPAGPTWQEIRCRVEGTIGVLGFELHNGAMAEDQCRRLLSAWERLRALPLKVLVLEGGGDFWSNGIHLHRIEAAPDPAEMSERTIDAMNDLTRAIIATDDRWVIACMRGNAGAGGVFLALAADEIWAAPGVILNPHYKNMGNLYGSEYWTYLLPRRAGDEAGKRIMNNRLPLDVMEAQALGLIDVVLDPAEWSGEGAASVLETGLAERIQKVAQAVDLPDRLKVKAERRQRDEAARPLEEYRKQEMERMRMNFYGFDPSYHVARYQFVHRVPHSRTPLHLAVHRNPARQRRPGTEKT